MTCTPVRVGLIGLGAIGYRVAKGLAQHPEFRITAVCDTNADLAAKTAAELGARLAWSIDYRTMLEGDQVDLVYIGVPPRFHHRIALDVIAAGKHIFCEKPLALTLDEARDMTEQARASGLVNAININMHYAPGIQVLTDRIAEGYLGELRRGELNMLFPLWPRAWQQNPWIGKREQGGPIREVCPHLFHAIHRIFGPVVRVRADMQYPAADPEACETGASGALELASGQIITVSALCNVPRPESVSLTAYGTRGTLGLANWVEPVGAVGQEPLEKLSLPDSPPLRLPDQLARAVRGERADLPDFAAGLALQQVLDAWERAAVSGGWVGVAK